MSGILFIISAPSGSGKTTLTNELLRVVPDLEFSISYTTRPPRGSEKHGREYFFVSREEFEEMMRRGEFLEHACVFGDYYGTARRFLDHARQLGKDLVLDIDVQGARQLKQKYPDAVSIFILPPSRKELEKRLRERSHAEHVDSEAIRPRLLAARKEIENYPDYDYILVNERLDTSKDQLKAIVLRERLRRSGAAPSAGEAVLCSLAEQCRQEKVRGRAQQILESFAMPASSRTNHEVTKS